MKKLKHIISNHLMMMKYFLKFAPAFFIANFLYCAYISFLDMLISAYAARYIFNGLSEGKGFRELFLFLIFVSAAMFIRNTAGGVIAEYLKATAFVKVNAGLNKIVFEQAKEMDLVYYETPEFYTSFVWAASQSDEKLWNMYGSWTVFVARLFDIIAFGGFMLLTDWRLMIFAFVLLIIRLIFNSKWIKKHYEMKVEIKPLERERDYMSRVFYLADYAKELRLSDMHRTLFSRLRNVMAAIKKINHEGGKKLVVYSLISSLSTEGFLDFGMYVYLCFRTLVTRTLMFGDLAALSSSVWNFAWRANDFIDILSELGEESLYVDKFREFLAYKPKIEHHGGVQAKNIPLAISLKNVSFKYEGAENYSLKNINLNIKPYEKIAIVGYNGAGKSTLVKLIMRLYDVTEGEITLAGVNIKEYSTDSYREVFGSVFQDYKVFAGTIAENVEMDFVHNDRRGTIEKSLDESGFGDKLIKLDMGIDTPLTREFDEDGVNLSGGEEQKIAIARIFARECSCVILDEPSSALDPISEYKLNQTMMTLSEHKTVIFISHRLSTTMMADRIIMLDNGEITEQGTHDELMAMDGGYARMFNKQAEKYRI